MAEIVGIFASSHTPVMLNFPDAIPLLVREEIYAGYRDLGKRIVASGAQALVIMSDDHIHNFFLNNFPAFCVGATHSYKSPAEHWLRAEPRLLPGDEKLGAYLLQRLLRADFDPSFSMELILDHGTLTPVELAHIDTPIPLVPVLINCVQPPMPTVRRCYILGKALGQMLRDYTGLERVAIWGTGGLSHDVGTPRMGMVNEAFDRELIRLFQSGSQDEVIRFVTDHVHEAGNGAEEIRMWVAAMGAAGENAKFDLRYYRAVESWYTGIAIADWV